MTSIPILLTVLMLLLLWPLFKLIAMLLMLLRVAYDERPQSSYYDKVNWVFEFTEHYILHEPNPSVRHMKQEFRRSISNG